MQRDLLFKYILDVEAVISEIDLLLNSCDRDFQKFEQDFMAKRTAERHLEIIGEAIKKMTVIYEDLPIRSKKDIIALRNLIIHAYDSVHPGVLWAILIRDIPELKSEIVAFRQAIGY